MLTAIKVWILLNMFLFAAAISAKAKDFPVNDEEQKNIAYICELAAKSPLVNIEQTAGIAQFCVAWKAKIAAADKRQEEQK